MRNQRMSKPNSMSTQQMSFRPNDVSAQPMRTQLLNLCVAKKV